MTDSISEFKKLLFGKTKEAIPVQTFWAIVKSVDIATQTMVAIVDDLEYFDILIGLGSLLTVPKVNTLCLIGIIENKHGAFLIDAKEIEKQILEIDSVKIEVSASGIKVERNGINLKDVTETFMSDVKSGMCSTATGPAPLDPPTQLKIQQSISKLNQILI